MDSNLVLDEDTCSSFTHLFQFTLASGGKLSLVGAGLRSRGGFWVQARVWTKKLALLGDP